MRLSHHLLALLVVFIWGTNFVFIRFGLDELPPFTFATLRFALVALPLVFFVSRPKVSWWLIAAYGLFIGVGQFGLLFWAMQSNISPGLASLIIQLQVFFTILLSAALFEERVNRSQIMALVLCFVGLFVVIFYSDGHTTILGVAVVLLAAISWSAGNVLVKQAGKVDYLAFIAWSSLFAILPLAALALVFEGYSTMVASVINARAEAWLIIAWQSVGNTLIGYGLWNMLLSKHSAATVTPWALMVPVFGMAASAIILGETLPWWKLLAIALILSGLILNAVQGMSRASKLRRKAR